MGRGTAEAFRVLIPIVPLLLCDAEDAPALWAWRHLVGRGVALDVVTSADLMRAHRWEHRLEGGTARALVELSDGRTIDTAEVRGTLNRLTAPRAELLGRAVESDRDYAVQEVWAMWMSWLHTLPEPVLNRVTPPSLSGPWPSYPQWLVHASEAGLRTAPWAGGETEPPRPHTAPMLFVAAGAVVGPRAPASVVRGCRALSAAVGCALLGVWFGPGWTFAGATAQPDLRRGGRALVDVLANALRGLE